jgi:hypothetical protein
MFAAVPERCYLLPFLVLCHSSDALSPALGDRKFVNSGSDFADTTARASHAMLHLLDDAEPVTALKSFVVLFDRLALSDISVGFGLSECKAMLAGRVIGKAAGLLDRVSAAIDCSAVILVLDLF